MRSRENEEIEFDDNMQDIDYSAGDFVFVVELSSLQALFTSKCSSSCS